MTGGAFYPGGVPFFLGNFTLGCRISGGAKITMKPGQGHELLRPGDVAGA